MTVTPTPDAGAVRHPPSPLSLRDGQPAGLASRAAQYVIDLAITSVSITIAIAATTYLIGLVLGEVPEVVQTTRLPELVGSAAVSGWWVLLMTYTVASFGQTPGMAIMGLRAERFDGRRVGWARALVRSILVPVILVVTFGIDAVAVLGRRRLALHDRVLRIRVVYGHGRLSRRTSRRVAAGNR